MADEEKEPGISHKDLLQQDLKMVDQMARWRQKTARGENIKVKILDKGMMPTIKIGDIAEVEAVQAMNLKTGNIIFYRQGETFLARRITEVSFQRGGEFTVKGDAIDKPEPTVNAAQVIGRITSIEREGEKIEVVKKFGGETLQKLKKLGSMEVGKVGPKKDYTKQKEIAQGVLLKIIEYMDIAYQKICELMDKIIEKLFRR
jgi:hypothetical protein